MKQFSKYRISNQKLLKAKQYLSDSMSKELNESFGVLAKKENEIENEIRENSNGIIRIAYEVNKKVQDYIEKYSIGRNTTIKFSLSFSRNQHNISWLDTLRLNFLVQNKIRPSGGVDPNDVKIESSGRVSGIIDLNINPENSDYELMGLFIHEMMHIFQILNWKGFYGKNAEDTYLKYTSSIEEDPLKKKYPFLLKGLDYNNLNISFSNDIPLSVQIAYCICRIGYYLNPLEMQAYLQQSYMDLARLFELSNKTNIKESSEKIIKIITKNLDYPLMFLKKYKEVCLENNLFDDQGNLEIVKSVSDLIPNTIEKIFRIENPNNKPLLFKSLNKIFERRFSYFRDKISRMHLLFKQEIKNFDNLLSDAGIVLYQEKDNIRLLSLKDMLYSKKFLPVYENYALQYQILKELSEQKMKQFSKIDFELYFSSPSPYVDKPREDRKIIFH